MSAGAVDAVRGSPVEGGPVDREHCSQDEIDERFLEIVLADPELVGAEFDALVAVLAGPPPAPVRPVDAPCGSRRPSPLADRHVVAAAGRGSGRGRWAQTEPRVRSPPALTS